MGQELRILDANLNRAREGLRVMEDLARFGLNDQDLAAALKAARHDLRAVGELANLDALTLGAWRDTPGDVGTGLTTASEKDRASLPATAIAAAKRAGEALRVIEETLKCLPGVRASGADGRAKALRYRVYELEKRLTLALGSGRGHQWRLCVLITESLCTHHRWDEVAAAAIRGGADCLQLREKGLTDRDLLSRAKNLVALARAKSDAPPAAVVINDRPDIALLADATGVHVGQDDLPIAEVRKMVGSRLLVGVSTGTMDQALAAAREGADYCGVGPMFETTTKHKPVLQGPEYLKHYLAEPRTARIPHLAIGGIDAAAARKLGELGCRGVAVSSAVCSAGDPEGACRAISEAIRSCGPGEHQPPRAIIASTLGP